MGQVLHGPTRRNSVSVTSVADFARTMAAAGCFRRGYLRKVHLQGRYRQPVAPLSGVSFSHHRYCLPLSLRPSLSPSLISRKQEDEWNTSHSQDQETMFHAFGQFSAEQEASSNTAEVKVCDCPPGWWGTRCTRLDLCVMEDAMIRFSASDPRCKHGELQLKLHTEWQDSYSGHLTGFASV